MKLKSFICLTELRYTRYLYIHLNQRVARDSLFLRMSGQFGEEKKKEVSNARHKSKAKRFSCN